MLKFDNYEQLKLENQLCFLVYSASRKIIRTYKKYLAEVDLTYTQYITMLVMWEKENLTSKELGSLLYLDSGTLTPLLKKLESQGIITRRRFSEDERNLLLSLTKKGLELKEKAKTIPEKLACDIGIQVSDLLVLRNKLKLILDKTIQG